MKVIALLSGNFATGYDRITTTYVRAGDVFEILNDEYAKECIDSKAIAPLKIEQTDETYVIETIDIDSVATSIDNKVEIISVPATVGIEEYKELLVQDDTEPLPFPATPQAIELAKELNIDITQVKAKGSKITVFDVKNYSKDSLV